MIHGLGRLIHAEFTKCRTVRSTWACFALAALALDGLGVLQLFTSPHPGPGDLAAGAGLSLLVLMAWGAVQGTADISFGTIRTTRAVAPHRARGFLAKSMTVGGLAALFGGLGGALLLVLAAATGRLEEITAGTLRATVGQAVTMGAAAALAAAVGMVVERTGLGVAVVIIWVQAVEPLMQLVPHVGRHVRDWLPFLNSMMFTNPQQFQQPPHGPVFACGYFLFVVLVALAAAGGWAVRKDY